MKTFFHVFTDGRDTDPKGGLSYVADLENHLNMTTGRIASVIGRYYSMDRDKRWGRIAKAYQAMVNGLGNQAKEAKQAIIESYKLGITDEFIEPIVITDEEGLPLAKIKEDDVVIMFNFENGQRSRNNQSIDPVELP